MAAKIPTGCPAVLRKERFGAGHRTGAFVIILSLIVFERRGHVTGHYDLILGLAAQREDGVIAQVSQSCCAEDA